MGLDIRLNKDGLTIYTDNPHPEWSYGGFHDFRQALAAHVGITLSEMDGFTYPGIVAKPWPNTPEPIFILLCHSDSQGYLGPHECGALAPRLREVIAEMGDKLSTFDREQGLLFAEFMERAITEGKRIEFR